MPVRWPPSPRRHFAASLREGGVPKPRSCPSRSAAWIARASLVEAAMLVPQCDPVTVVDVAMLVPQCDPVTVVDVVMKTALEIWSAHSDHAVCLELGVSSWEGLWSTLEGCHEVLDGIRASARVYREETWLTAGSRLGIQDPDIAESMATAYLEAQRAGHRLIDGAAQVIRSLAADYRLGLLTNGPADVQRLKLQATGLVEYFDADAMSGEIGTGNADPRAYASVLNLSEVEGSRHRGALCPLSPSVARSRYRPSLRTPAPGSARGLSRPARLPIPFGASRSPSRGGTTRP